MSVAIDMLAIEVSNPSSGAAEVAVWAGERVEIEAVGGRGGAGGRGRRGGQDDDLMPAIERVFARMGAGAGGRGLKSAGHEGAVAVSVGPGGYTGLRVACAVGKMIAEGAGVKCIGVPSAWSAAQAWAISRRAGGETHGRTAAVALASKGESAWVEVFSWTPAFERPAPVGAGRLMTGRDVAGLRESGVDVLLGDEFLPEGLRREAERAGIEIEPLRLTARACGELAKSLPRVDPAELVPLYPREPDAVTLWRAAGKGGGGGPRSE